MAFDTPKNGWEGIKNITEGAYEQDVDVNSAQMTEEAQEINNIVNSMSVPEEQEEPKQVVDMRKWRNSIFAQDDDIEMPKPKSL